MRPRDRPRLRTRAGPVAPDPVDDELLRVVAGGVARLRAELEMPSIGCTGYAGDCRAASDRIARRVSQRGLRLSAAAKSAMLLASMKPVLLVTSDVPPDRVAPFRALNERVPIVVARFGGARRHAATGVEDPGVPVLDVSEHAVFRLAASGRFRAVVAGTVGKVALPAAYAGARARRTPFVLWSALWSQPHLLSAPLMLHLYGHADAVAAYGEHVAAYAKARGARSVHLAPQAVDAAFWAERATERRGDGGLHALYVGRIEAEKGVHVLLDAWRRAALPGARLTLVGPGGDGLAVPEGVVLAGPQPPEEVRNFLGAAGLLVVPSIATRAFKEPWALVVNEAMHQQLPVIATDAVGAAAGGLVRDGRNGLVVRQGDPDALAVALATLAGDPALREALGANGARDVSAFTPEAWAAGMIAAVRSAAPESVAG